MNLSQRRVAHYSALIDVLIQHIKINVEKKQELFQEEYNSKIENAPIAKLNEIEFLTPTQATILLGLIRATLSLYISEDIIKSVQFKRKTLLKKRY